MGSCPLNRKIYFKMSIDGTDFFVKLTETGYWEGVWFGKKRK
jgi:hypothetical protein